MLCAGVPGKYLTVSCLIQIRKGKERNTKQSITNISKRSGTIRHFRQKSSADGNVQEDADDFIGRVGAGRNLIRSAVNMNDNKVFTKDERCAAGQ